MLYTVIIEPYEGGFTATVPDVPGCATGGATVEEALEAAADALCGCLCVYQDEGIEYPPTRMPNQFADLPKGAVATLVRADLLDYRRRTDQRAVRKNVSMPAWLAELADRRGVNCSQVLQEALIEAVLWPLQHPETFERLGVEPPRGVLLFLS